jgi:flagellar hook-associated protein 2
VDGSVKAVDNAAGFLGEAAKDAAFTIDGLPQTSATNTLTDVVPGVTFNLLSKTEPDKPLTLTVGQDKAGVTSSIKKFVDAYNKLIKTSSELTNVVQVGEGKPPVVGGLVGDATVRTWLSGVRNELVNPAGQEGLRVLADLGITTQKDGTLKIDDAKLGTAITDNFDALGSFFTGDSGLMSRIDKRIDGYIQTGGVLEQRMKGLQTTLSEIDKQKETLARRVSQIQTRLFAQFNAMDALVGNLNATSDRLAQALGSLPGVVKQSN